MKVRTHITIEKEILDTATEDARRLGLSISSYVGLLMLNREDKLKQGRFFHVLDEEPHGRGN